MGTVRAALRAASRAQACLRQSSAITVRSSSRRYLTQDAQKRGTWGFIGLGQMGYSMAKNLRNKIPADDVLYVQDVNAEATSKFANEFPKQQVVVAKSAREVAEQAATTISALPNPAIVKSIYDSILSEKALPDLGSERIFIDTSTIDPATSISVAQGIETSGHFFVDAPMSGGVVGASAGTLTFMLGCPETLVAQATDILSMMGRRVLHMGPPGSGLKAKLANNYLLALNNIATAEAMHMGIQWGLDAKALADLINISTGKCWPSEVNNPVPGVLPGSPASRDYAGGFGVALMNKDLKLAIKACNDAGVKLAMGDAAGKVYDAVQADEKLRTKDFSVVYRWLGGKE